MPILMASPCSPLDLFLEGINFMDPIALDGRREATDGRETPAELPRLLHILSGILKDLGQKWSILRLNISVLSRDTQAKSRSSDLLLRPGDQGRQVHSAGSLRAAPCL